MPSNFEILDSITESMAVINHTGEILFTNKAWRVFSEENMGDESGTGINNNYLAICAAVEGEESEMAKNANFGIKRVINKELEVFELEYPCHSPVEKRWFILRASSISTNPELTLLAHISITNRKLAELEVEKNYSQSLDVNERLNTTLYRIVHDIQNPLASIIGIIDLSKSVSDPESLNTFLGMIEKGSAGLSDFIKETLNHISTPEDIHSLDFRGMTSKYIETVQPLLISNSIEIKLDIHQKGEFKTNIIEFRSILSNLIGNSIKYCDDLKREKFISIKFRSDENGAVLKVSDNGIGIKAEELPKLMQRNYQVNSKSKRGVGLGLFLVETAISMLGGSIKVNSEFGLGTEFIVEIPNKTERA